MTESKNYSTQIHCLFKFPDMAYNLTSKFTKKQNRNSKFAQTFLPL